MINKFYIPYNQRPYIDIVEEEKQYPTNEFAIKFIQKFKLLNNFNLETEISKVGFILTNLRYCRRLEQTFSITSNKFMVPLASIRDVPLAAMLSICTFLDLFLEGLVTQKILIVFWLLDRTAKRHERYQPCGY